MIYLSIIFVWIAGETKSILVSLGEKKVTLTYEYAKQEASTFAFLNSIKNIVPDSSLL